MVSTSYIQWNDDGDDNSFVLEQRKKKPTNK